MTVDSPIIKRFVGAEHIALPDGLRLQVLPDLAALPACQKNQSAAFINDRAQLIVCEWILFSFNLYFTQNTFTCILHFPLRLYCFTATLLTYT